MLNYQYFSHGRSTRNIDFLIHRKSKEIKLENGNLVFYTSNSFRECDSSGRQVGNWVNGDMINPEDSGATRETIRSLSRIDKENAINGLARTPSTNGWNCYQDLRKLRGRDKSYSKGFRKNHFTSPFVPVDNIL